MTSLPPLSRGSSPMRRGSLLFLPALAIVIPIAGIVWADTAIRALGEDPGSTPAFLAAVGVLGGSAAGVGAAILWRQPGNRIGALMLAGALLLETGIMAFPLTILRVTTAGPADTLAGIADWWGVVAVVAGIVVLFPAVGILFPDGHLPGPRWRLPVMVGVAAVVGGSLLQAISPWPQTDESIVANPFAIAGLSSDLAAIGATATIAGAFALFAIAVAAIARRYQRSSGVERTQIKWPVAALAVIAVAFPVSEVTEVDAIDVLSVSLGALVPMSIGIAILRYRLFEIDRIVSRTIAYLVLTAILVGAYAGVILLLQGPLGSITGGDTIPVAMSTLLVAALFQPLRRRVQTFVDRRFDRARFDAERTAASFADRLRDTIDIEAVTADLGVTVQEALKPARQGLWIRKAVVR